MWTSDRFRYLLLGLTVALTVAAVSLTVMMSHTDEAVERTTNHDIAWTAANARMEVADLARAILEDDRDGRDLARQILESRLSTWHAGAFRTFVDADPRRRVTIEEIGALLDRLNALLSSGAAPQTRGPALDLIDRMAGKVDALAADALNQSNLEIAENRAHLQAIEYIERLIQTALLVVGFALILIMGGQNRRLRAASEAERAAAARFEHVAAHDVLTGLPNRRTFRAACDQVTGRLNWADRMAGRSAALLLLDLDGFKPINDTLGHAFGDGILRATADRLRAFVADLPGAVTGRMGGDEFMVLIPGCESPKAASELAQALHRAIRKEHVIDGIPLMVDVSVGLALVEEPGTTSEQLMQRADLALNAAKGRGKGLVMTYAPEMDDDISRRRVIETELAQAIAREEIEPFYQPVTNMVTGEIVAVEALARWRHPVRGLIPPGEFIPVAEASGQIVEIGRIILEKACRDAARFARPVPVAVNLSTVQLMRVDVAAIVAEVLERTGLPPARLKLEITESVMVTDEERTRDMIARLRALGAAVSLDDFGTGYSSLAYLRGYGFDEMKIDKSFVATLSRDPESLIIVQTIVTLARNLGLRLVAEGVETEQQVKLLMACGCTCAQGYLFSPPRSAADIAHMLGDHDPTTRQAA